MSRIKGQPTTSDYLTIDEFNKLANGLREDKLYVWEAYVVLSFCTALRISDVLKLTWGDVFADKIRVNEQKTKKHRTILINSDVKSRLVTIYNLLNCPAYDTIIVHGEKNNGQPMSREYINRRLKFFKVDYRLSIGSFSSHTFRKTFGRFVYESNNKSAESLMLLNSIFKHSNLEVTKRYIGLTQDNINQVFESIKI